MAKRYNNYPSNISKKPKLDDEDVWDDEGLDDEALDKWFDMATQKAAEDPPKDTSLLPSYNAFLNPNAFSASTQAGTYKTNENISLQELQVEINKLKQLNAEKDGEISVLRSKINDSKVNHQVEQQKTTNEWREKCHMVTKEVNAVKSHLEFKNLEIANLKQQLANQRRINLDATLSTQQLLMAPEPPVERNTKTVIEPSKSVQKAAFPDPSLDRIYPLKFLTSINFTENNESHIVKTTSYKISRNTIPYLQNQQTCNETNFNHKCPRIAFEDVSHDILILASSNLEDIKNISQVIVNKIIAVSLILLQDLSDYIIEFSSHLKTEDVQQYDVDYLQNNNNSESLNLGLKVSKLLLVIAQLILYNKHIANFVCYDKLLKLQSELRNYAFLIPHRNGCIQNDYYFLKLLLTIVRNIGKFRLTRHANDFLIATTSLLENIAIMENGNFNNDINTFYITNDDLFFKLFKEIVFARPSDEVLEKLTGVLKSNAQCNGFISFLFKKNPNSQPLKTGPKKGILLYNEDVCCFFVLAIQLQNYLLRVEKLPLNVCYNLLSFMYNTLKTSHWIHHESSEHVCDACLSQLYKLEIQFVYKALIDFNKYHKERKNSAVSDESKNFLKNELIQKVLNQMKFNNLQLIDKNVMVLAQYKEIVEYLENEGVNVDELDIKEEIPVIPPENFPDDF